MPRRRDTPAASAAEYVLGTLDAAGRARLAEALAHDAGLRAEVDRWERRLAPLAGAVAPVAPPARVLDAIRERIDGGKPYTVRQEEGDWVTAAPGVARKTLMIDRAANSHAFLLRFEPGGVIEAHRHGADEECLMLEGEAYIGTLLLVAGDYHLAPRGTTHATIRSERGALVYIRGEIYE
jgi:quercetin dioxygenase-like cupin family protein